MIWRARKRRYRKAEIGESERLKQPIGKKRLPFHARNTLSDMTRHQISKILVLISSPQIAIGFQMA